MINTVGYRESERAIQLGTLFNVDEALKIKLIDEICAPNILLEKAEEQMQIWCKIPSKTLVAILFKFFIS